MADGDLISRASLLAGIAELKESPWYNFGKVDGTNFKWMEGMWYYGYLQRKEAVEIIEDICIKKEPAVLANDILKQIKDFKKCVKSENSDYITGYLSALSAVEGMLANYDSGWISVKDRMPEKSVPVLICANGRRVTAYYDKVKAVFRLTEDDNMFYLTDFVTHWMPLPEPPKEDNNEIHRCNYNSRENK